MRMEKTKHSTRDSLFITSIQKGVRILEVFNSGARHLSLSEMVQKSGMNKSSVQRIVYTWEQLGYLEKEARSKRYQLTPKSLTLSFNYLRTNPLVEVATPHLVTQSSLTDHTFNLSILDGYEIVYIIRVPNHRQALSATLLGRRLPAFLTSGGRAMMSHMSGEDVAGILDKSNLERRTPHTITDRELIIAEIERAKEQGYAIAVQESLIGEIVVASPVLDSESKPVGAVHIPNYFKEWPLERVQEELAPLAIETARAISAY